MVSPSASGGYFDVDNHYYEPLDACTRHLPSQFRHRGVEFVERKGRTICLIGGRVNEFIPNPTFEPIAKPGCADEFFRGRTPVGTSFRDVMELDATCDPSYRDPVARLAVMDEQGLQASVLYPTFGYALEEGLSHDPEAGLASIEAFNRWLQDDWSYNYEDRIFTAPLLALGDVDRAARELDRVLAAGARVVAVRPAPAITPAGRRSIGHRDFDPIWGRLQEAGVPVAFHVADSGYQRYAADWDDAPAFKAFTGANLMGQLFMFERPISDTIAAMVVHGAARRFSALKMISVENGALWLPLLLKKLDKVYRSSASALFDEPPLDMLRQRLFVSPYAEDDIAEVVDTLGASQVLFGSDWPHAEGLAHPSHYLKLLDGLPERDVQAIMVDNTRSLLGLDPAR